ncbi:MAG: carbohydrate kinase [Sphaerochaetaceae bacterium]|nr:carbohydrate kinase [Sphaerochaetaceae bacterium]
MTLKITTIGEVLVDLTQTSIDSNGITHFAANPGGAPANVAVAASKLGVETAFVGCVGKDSFGELLRQALLRYGVNTDGLQVTSRTGTTLAVVTVAPSGERSFSFFRTPGADTQIDETEAMKHIRGTDILHFGSVSLTDPACREVIMNVVSRAKEEGVIVTYDPNFRASLWDDHQVAVRRMRDVLPYCDIIKISDEETELLTGEKEPMKAAKVLLDKGLKLVLVTLGPDGALFCTKDTFATVPGYRVKVADTNGAGDTFFGALLSCLAKRGSIENLTKEELTKYVDFANRAASITTSRSGAMPAMPYFKEVE